MIKNFKKLNDLITVLALLIFFQGVGIVDEKCKSSLLGLTKVTNQRICQLIDSSNITYLSKYFLKRSYDLYNLLKNNSTSGMVQIRKIQERFRDLKTI